MNASPNFGVYIHTPFCKSKCAYCSFASIPMDDKLAQKYIRALLKEVSLLPPKESSRRIDSIYFGGGTPSLLPLSDLGSILNSVTNSIGRVACAEITIEANPETICHTYLEGLLKLGFNRLSLGAQSFDNRFLSLLGRGHDANAIEKAAKLARKAGFTDINLDLLIGAEKGRERSVLESVKRATGLEVDHISAYVLELHPGLSLFERLRSGGLNLIDEDSQSELYLKIVQILNKAGFEQYEISNFAKKGHQCRHNLTYWQRGEYVGLGSSAHSFLSGVRSRNHSDPNTYIKMVDSIGQASDFSERLTPTQEINERIILGLRLTRGLDPLELKECLSKAQLDEFFEKAQDLVLNGFLETEDRVRLASKGMLVSNDILARLIPG